MVLINKIDKEKLEKVGLWKHKRQGKFAQESNFSVCNKQHNSRAKTYYIVENEEVMRFLGMWEKSNVVQISLQQFEELKRKKIIDENNIQRYNEYVIGAKCFIANDGNVYVAREKKMLLALKD